MSFTVIPAVDIRQGRCVRLYRGSPGAQTVFSHDPVEAALGWEEHGAERLHVVDLDGAFRGRPVNFELICRLSGSLAVPVQVGGGIRTTEDAEAYLEAGVERVIVGTSAFSNPRWLRETAARLGERLVVGLDSREGRVTINGWMKDVETTPVEAMRELASAGVRRVVFTSTSRDGTLEGPDIEAIEEVTRSSGIPLIASGGVGGLEDVARLSRLAPQGVEGVIVGMALYRGVFTLEEAIRTAEKEKG